VVIEDVDLDASQLRNHLHQHQLFKLAATDATDRSPMHTANLLCISERKNASILPGWRLW
jgi:hypothetical protein